MGVYKKIMAWIISIPVWGSGYISTFVRVAAPALVLAARRLREPVKFVLHTSAEGGAAAAALEEFLVEVRAIPDKPTYVALQEGHADAVRKAAPGDRVVLLNADLAVSVNLLERCAEHFAVGKRAVVLMGIRTTAGPEAPPAGAEPRALLEWAWTHRHQIIRDLEWPHGGSMLPTNLFWSEGESTVARGFHLHPAAVVKHDGMSFHSTIDGDLLDCIPREGIHVVTDPDDCSMCEVSPPERRFPVRDARMSAESVVKSMLSRASPMHRWLFRHRIVVRGSGAEVRGDSRDAHEILDRMSGSRFGNRLG
jgi:hypothetical protein